MTLTIGPMMTPPLPGLAPSDGAVPAKEVRDVAAGVLGNQASIQRYIGGLLQGGVAEPPKLPPVAPPGNDAVNSAIATLGGLSLSGGINMQAIARAVYDDARESRTAMRTDRQVARDAAMQADQAAADDVRSSAHFTEVATIVSSALSMAGAVITAGDAINTLHMLLTPPSTPQLPPPGSDIEMTEMPASNAPKASSGDNSSSGTKSATESKAADNTVDSLDDTPEDAPEPGATKKKSLGDRYREMRERYDKMDSGQQTQFLSSKSGVVDGMSKILDGIGKISAAQLSATAAGHDADKLEQQAESTKQQSKADDDSDFVRTYTDLASSVLDKLSAMQEAQSQANQAIIANTKA